MRAEIAIISNLVVETIRDPAVMAGRIVRYGCHIQLAGWRLD